MMLRGANIGIVIAGNHRDPVGWTDALQPCPRRHKLGFERQIDEVAGDRDVVRRLGLHIRNQRVQHVAPVELAAVARPVEIAEHAFAHKFAGPRPRQRRDMRIGQMRQREGRHHLRPLRLLAERSRCAIIS